MRLDFWDHQSGAIRSQWTGEAGPSATTQAVDRASQTRRGKPGFQGIGNRRHLPFGSRLGAERPDKGSKSPNPVNSGQKQPKTAHKKHYRTLVSGAFPRGLVPIALEFGSRIRSRIAGSLSPLQARISFHCRAPASLQKPNATSGAKSPARTGLCFALPSDRRSH